MHLPGNFERMHTRNCISFLFLNLLATFSTFFPLIWLLYAFFFLKWKFSWVKKNPSHLNAFFPGVSSRWDYYRPTDANCKCGWKSIRIKLIANIRGFWKVLIKSVRPSNGEVGDQCLCEDNVQCLHSIRIDLFLNPFVALLFWVGRSFLHFGLLLRNMWDLCASIWFVGNINLKLILKCFMKIMRALTNSNHRKI